MFGGKNKKLSGRLRACMVTDLSADLRHSETGAKYPEEHAQKGENVAAAAAGELSKWPYRLEKERKERLTFPSRGC